MCPPNSPRRLPWAYFCPVRLDHELTALSSGFSFRRVKSMKTISRRAAIQCLLSLLPSPFIIPSPTERVLLAVPKRKRAFKHSDVVFSFVFSPEEYKMWHGTLLYGWCGAPATKDEIPKYLDRQKKSLEVGVPEGASISGFSGNLSWFQEQDPDWKEALWRDSDDNLLTYPWVRPPDPFPPEKGEIG